jgi:hypothetical protein
MGYVFDKKQQKKSVLGFLKDFSKNFPKHYDSYYSVTLLEFIKDLFDLKTLPVQSESIFETIKRMKNLNPDYVSRPHGSGIINWYCDYKKSKDKEKFIKLGKQQI